MTLISNFYYELPEDKIAKYPLKNRDNSKLLVYKQGAISHEKFNCIDKFLPTNTLLVFNNTKVIPARIIFKKDTGALIEIFLLEPDTNMEQAMEAKNCSTWYCMIGNKKKWRGETLKLLLKNNSILEAKLIDDLNNRVEFKWNSDQNFSEIICEIGEIPLPPYLNRKADKNDALSYQTVYSKINGAVAAPTAGLHFTEKVFENLAKKNIKTEYLTLHVGAGTFQPIKSKDIESHSMHQEAFIVSVELIEKLAKNDQNIVAVGTTSTRTLESLYWFGIKVLRKEFSSHLEQDYAYKNTSNFSRAESLNALKNYLMDNNFLNFTGSTSIYIRPGYEFKVVNGIVTNFHQPNSSLILLIAGFIGEDWRKIYNEALVENYRFLSYGDSSLIIP